MGECPVAIQTLKNIIEEILDLRKHAETCPCCQAAAQTPLPAQAEGFPSEADVATMRDLLDAADKPLPEGGGWLATQIVAHLLATDRK